MKATESTAVRGHNWFSVFILKVTIVTQSCWWSCKQHFGCTGFWNVGFLTFTLTFILSYRGWLRNCQRGILSVIHICCTQYLWVWRINRFSYQRMSHFLHVWQIVGRMAANWTGLHLTFAWLWLGKVFIGNKRDIAEGRIPELNTYMKVITCNWKQFDWIRCLLFDCWLQPRKPTNQCIELICGRISADWKFSALVCTSSSACRRCSSLLFALPCAHITSNWL